MLGAGSGAVDVWPLSQFLVQLRNPDRRIGGQQSSLHKPAAERSDCGQVPVGRAMGRALGQARRKVLFDPLPGTLQFLQELDPARVNHLGDQASGLRNVKLVPALGLQVPLVLGRVLGNRLPQPFGHRFDQPALLPLNAPRPPLGPSRSATPPD